MVSKPWKKVRTKEVNDVRFEKRCSGIVGAWEYMEPSKKRKGTNPSMPTASGTMI